MIATYFRVKRLFLSYGCLLIICIFFTFLIMNYKVKNTISFKSQCKCKTKEKIFLSKPSDGYFHVNYKTKTGKYRSYKFKSIGTKFTCDIYNSLRRGQNLKVIGLSLYGTNQRYYKLLKNITHSIKKMYPEWIVRVYYDDTILKSTICEIECQNDENNNLIDNTDFCNINKLPLSVSDKDLTWSASYLHKTMWRWLPIGDSFVDVFSSRDADAQIRQREVDSVQYWLGSNKTGHIMRGLFKIHHC